VVRWRVTTRSGKTVRDPATVALLDLAGDVSGLRLLEVACGQGRVARELARRGAALTGLDISAALLARARAYEAAEPLGIRYLHADVTSGGVLEGQVFDGVVCNYGLSDIDDLDGLLANVARLLRPGGWFVFSLLHPCFPGWDSDAPSSWPPGRGYYQEGLWLASVIERRIQTCRRELPDRTLIWNERHLLHAPRKFESSCNEHRPHRTLGQAAPLRSLPAPTSPTLTR
jgi:ubiquinone/menaquinone biosynthesis C-methylase UbiE